MLTITEIPHRGNPRTWTAADEDDFCIKVQQAKPTGEWEHDWTFSQFRDYLAEDLRKLDISDGEEDHIHTNPDFNFDIRADFAQAACSLEYRMHGSDEDWHGTLYRVAGHDVDDAFRIVDDYLNSGDYLNSEMY